MPCRYHCWGMPGQRAGSPFACSICASTMPRAQNMTVKGSILLWRQLTFPIFLLFVYDSSWAQCKDDHYYLKELRCLLSLWTGYSSCVSSSTQSPPSYRLVYFLFANFLQCRLAQTLTVYSDYIYYLCANKLIYNPKLVSQKAFTIQWNPLPR